jgi:hypothetical protein
VPEPLLSPTPTATKVILVATLAATGAALRAYVESPGAGTSQTAAPYLAGFTALFLTRVGGQIFVRARRPGWLPPTEQWNLSPYGVLLPTQVAMLALMVWIDVDFARDRGFWTEPRPSLGVGVLWFAAVYATAMAIRYIVRMRRRPDQRWFGGTIPIVFHWVLAAYLLVFGSFHASH